MRTSASLAFTALFAILILFGCPQDGGKKEEEVLREGTTRAPHPDNQAVLVIHGGAGFPSAERNNPHTDSLIKDEMSRALLKGREIILAGGNSLDAVQAAIRLLEDSPLFNAGKGAVFNSEGRNELDACLMEGSELKAGAVAGVSTIKNPIDAARLVMDSSGHVLLTGKGAETFAASKGMKAVDPSYFFTQESWNEYLKANGKTVNEPQKKNQKLGTVGAVAVDLKGNIAAGTSTGGRTNKKWGRVGDSPVIGASTYADNRYCGVSSTGWGEYFIRHATAHSVVAGMEYKNYSVKEAAEHVMYEKMKGIEGGIIVLDNKGNFSMPFNTPVMNRGYITLKGEPQVFIYK